MPRPVSSPTGNESASGSPAGAAGRLSPTDISQFIRLEQCERYLRLRMRERAEGSRFMADYGVAPQAIPPLLTRSGSAFEARMEGCVRERFTAFDCAAAAGNEGDRGDDNARVAAAARELAPGEVRVLFQPRLQAELGGWQLHGDVDILRLEREADGGLQVLIADVKSSTRVKVEHRLQVAFYQAMIARLLEQEEIEVARIRTAILYRGTGAFGAAPSSRLQAPGSDQAGPPAASPPDTWSLEPGAASEASEAARLLGTEEGLLEIVTDPEAYLDAVRDLVTGPESAARRIARTPLAETSYHLSHKCDGCLYNEHCMKWSAEQDDLSLIPHLNAREKRALQRAGVPTTRELAGLKEIRRTRSGQGETIDLVPAAGKEELCRRVATTWPVGHRLDELIHRARRYRRWRGDPLDALPSIPSKGYGTLPYCDARHNPNLVRIFIDAQHDYLNDRIYLLGALVVGCEGGEPRRRRSIVHLAEGPPDREEKEQQLFVRWIRDLLTAVVECAAPDVDGQPRAPIHLIFFDRFEQKALLEGLSRHLSSILGAAPALYDFMTQLAGFDSPIASFLDEEIRELKNYPMVCQSLQAVAGYLRFEWDASEPFTRNFHARLFDQWRKLEREDEAPQWYTGRARFNSQIPLEHAYAAWGELEPHPSGDADEESFRQTTVDRLCRFQARRLEALERITADFPGNRLTEKRPFSLPDLAAFTDTARSLAQALDEFVIIERHVALHHWKGIRHAPPERRALLGETLLVRYREEEQEPCVAAANRENERRRQLREQYEASAREQDPDAARVALSKEQQAETKWSADGLRVRLRLETEGLEYTLDEALALLTLQPGDMFVLNPRWTVDGRLPEEQQVEFTPTPKQMLYGLRAAFAGLQVERDAHGKIERAWVDVELQEARGGPWSRGFVFSTFPRVTLAPGRLYTLDPCPNDWYGYFCAMVTHGLRAAEEAGQPVLNTLYQRVRDRGDGEVLWPSEAAAGQARFLAGLDALHDAGELHELEPGKRAYIGGRGEAPILLVQGPPGTGKSYATAFALFARMQGALAAGLPFRAIVCCKTHAATDVLLTNLIAVRDRLRQIRASLPQVFAERFDDRLLEAPLYRVAGRQPAPEGAIPLPKDRDKARGEPKNADLLAGERCCLVAATPAAVYTMVKEKWGTQDLFGHSFCDCLVLDEASQMNLPEAAMAALPLRADGALIVVGDHRQMPPIVKHDWAGEPRRTFREYRAYESLFQTLLPLASARIQFEESFRLHAQMAEFLRQEIYDQDGIRYHSRRCDLLPPLAHDDPFLAAVLAPERPLIVVVHDEAGSQSRNPFEQKLISPVLEALSDPGRYGLDAATGLGVVVPHRAQRAAVQSAFPALCVLDEATGTVLRSAVDTVERFQGDERTVILVSATESDREYLLTASEFLLDPRRLTVALSRAKRKLVLVASRSVFSLFSPDEETFAHAQLWKNLLRRTCTEQLWAGERDGHRVEVWGAAKSKSVN